MSKRDLTRWNRARLARFRYVDGNAPTYLEHLRLAMLARYAGLQGDAARPEWWRDVFATETQTKAEKTARKASLEKAEKSLKWPDLWVQPPDRREGASDRNARLESQYRGQRRDWAWEIMRTLARSSHVLTEYLNAYANEGYLQTATQWDRVRQLAARVGYRPAPPASAATWLVIEAKADQSGTLEAGFQVKHTPAAGGAALVFETLEDLALDAQLNGLRDSDWNNNSWSFSRMWEENDAWTAWIAPKTDKLSAGQVAIVGRTDEDLANNENVNDDNPVVEALLLSAVDQDSGVLQLNGKDGEHHSWHDRTIGRTFLWLAPSRIWTPQLNSNNTVVMSGPHGLAAGDVVAWQVSGNEWRMARVAKADPMALQLDLPGGVSLPTLGKALYRAVEIPRKNGQLTWAENVQVVAYSDLTVIPTGPDSKEHYEKISTEVALDPAKGHIPQVFHSLLSNEHDIILSVPAEATAAGYRVASEGDLVFVGKPGKLTSGSRVVLVDENQAIHAGIVQEVLTWDGYFGLEMVGDLPADTIVSMHGPMTMELRPQDYSRNPEPLSGKKIHFDLAKWPGVLIPGRRLVLGPDPADETAAGIEPLPLQISLIDSNSGEITLDRALTGSEGYTKGNALFYANVVEAGHGETMPRLILGSGDGSQTRQTFCLDEPDLAYVSDASMSAGVAPALTLSVGQRSYGVVADLANSEAEDAHYEALLNQDGALQISFGDGQHGRLLPTGSNNVTAVYRKGNGTPGNLAAGSLIKPAKPHYLVERVSQPFDASGGSDGDDVADMRSQAPDGLQALGRAVSAQDFARLAKGYVGVAQAIAVEQLPPMGRRASVHVVAVPENGDELGDLEAKLLAFLENNCLPAITVTLEDYQPISLCMQVTLYVQTDQYDGDLVTDDVRAALIDAFSRRARKLGQTLYLSEVYAVVENVEGVRNSHVVLCGNRDLRKQEAECHQIIHFAEDSPELDLSYQTYQP